MSTILINDWFCFCFVILVFSFLILDEEPFFDPTDWNIIHILLFFLSTFVIIWDNIIRSRYGQFSFKDQILVFSTFSFWFSIENYSRLIVIIFCFHCLSPLELELCELVEVYGNLLVWYSFDILIPLLILLFIFFLALIINFVWNWINCRNQLIYIFFIVLILLFNLLFLLWDFLTSSFGNCLFSNNIMSYYNTNRASICYDMTLFVEDTFDWHISNPTTFIFRFEDLYLFYIQLFNIIILYACTFIWIFFFLDILTNYNIVAYSALPGTIVFLGICMRWLDHALWCFIYSGIAVLLVSLRIYLLYI